MTQYMLRVTLNNKSNCLMYALLQCIDRCSGLRNEVAILKYSDTQCHTSILLIFEVEDTCRGNGSWASENGKYCTYRIVFYHSHTLDVSERCSDISFTTQYLILLKTNLLASSLLINLFDSVHI